MQHGYTAQEVHKLSSNTNPTHADRQTDCAWRMQGMLHLLCRYLERQRYMANLSNNSKHTTTFEDFCVHVVHTATTHRQVSPQLSAPPTTANAASISPAVPINSGQPLPSPPPVRRRANTFSGSTSSREQHKTTPHLGPQPTTHHTTPHTTPHYTSHHTIPHTTPHCTSHHTTLHLSSPHAALSTYTKCIVTLSVALRHCLLQPLVPSGTQRSPA